MKGNHELSNADADALIALAPRSHARARDLVGTIALRQLD
jgi:hypothetical protein